MLLSLAATCMGDNQGGIYVTQGELMRLFEGDIKTDILNSTYCSISKEHFDTKMIFMSYSDQKLKII